MGTLWHGCAKVHETIELLFGAASGVSQGISVLDGVNVPQEERGFGFFCGPLI